MSGAFKQMTDSNMCLLEALLMENIEKVIIICFMLAKQLKVSFFMNI